MNGLEGEQRGKIRDDAFKQERGKKEEELKPPVS
jgi:hypothetical protein